MNVFKKTAMLGLLAIGFSASNVHAQSFDYLLLATSWQAGFCANHQTKPECQTLKGTYAANNLALHGMWPNAYDGNHPFYCGVAASQVTLDKAGNWCAMSSYGLTSSTLSTLRTYMPGAGATTSCLDNHEWYKHGTCSAQAPNTYWSDASTMMSRLGQSSFNTFLKNSAGRYVTRTQLLNAFDTAFGSGTRAALSLNCTKIGTVSYFTEAWIAVKKTGIATFPSAGSLVLDGPISSSCPSSSIYIALP